MYHKFLPNENFTSNYNYWIVKPPDLFQGMGIKVLKDFKEINAHCQNIFNGIEKVSVEHEEYCKKNNIEIKPAIYKSEFILIQKYLKGFQGPFIESAKQSLQ